MHLILWPSLPDHPVSQIMWHLKRNFARTVIGRWKSLEAPILARLRANDGSLRFRQRGGGYDRNLFSESQIREKANYMHENPVRRGLTARSVDWLWSSARWYAGLADGPLAMDPIRRPGP